MEVRCDNCHTEYELDEGKLKPAGVTVKCTACGHLFKVRKRTPTLIPHAGAVPIPKSGASSLTAVAVAPQEEAERTWLIRLEDGEIKTCRELATLQQWIATGRVGRGAEISRTGKKWKRLGEIGELASYFEVADQAHRSRPTTRPKQGTPRGERGTPTPVRTPPVGAGARSPHPRLVPAGSSRPVRASSVPAAPPPGAVAGAEPAAGAGAESPRAGGAGAKPPVSPAAGAEPAAGAGAESPRAAAPAPASPAAPAQESASPALLSSSPRSHEPSPPAAPAAAMSDDFAKTGAWAAASPVKLEAEDGGPTGPIGGLARGVPTDDVAFAHSPGEQKIAPIRDDFGGGAGEDRGGDLPPRRSRAALWIVLFSLVVMGGAAVVVFLFVLNPSGKSRAAAVVYDAGVPIATPLIAPAAPADGGVSPAALASARAALRADTEAGLTQAASDLAAISGGEHSVTVLALRSRIEASLAQHARDDIALATDSTRRHQLRNQVTSRADRARTLARRALALAPNNVAVQVALADALRLTRASARQMERPLRKARQMAPSDRELKLVRALVDIDQRRYREARRLLSQLGAAAGAAKTTGDVRPIFRLAMLEFSQKKYDRARAGAAAVLAAEPQHEGAKALTSRIDALTAVASTDPIPTETHAGHGGAKRASTGGAKRASTGGAKRAPTESYASLVRRADKTAEHGDCRAARKLYKRALDLNPAGAAALTGLGYCHLDAREFASAHANFRAALGVSPGYEQALYGIAEAYQQQGLRDRAVQAYKHFLRVHPTGERASMARRQIEDLGGNPAGAGAGGAPGRAKTSSGGAGQPGHSGGATPSGSGGGGASSGASHAGGTSAGGASHAGGTSAGGASHAGGGGGGASSGGAGKTGGTGASGSAPGPAASSPSTAPAHAGGGSDPAPQ